MIFNSYLERKKKKGESPSGKNLFSPIFEQLIKHRIRPKWEKHLTKILERENGIEALLLLGIPLNHIKGIPSKIKKEFGIPVVYYDGDMPTILPTYIVNRGFRFNYYESVDLSEYEAFFF